MKTRLLPVHLHDEVNYFTALLLPAEELNFLAGSGRVCQPAKTLHPAAAAFSNERR